MASHDDKDIEAATRQQKKFEELDSADVDTAIADLFKSERGRKLLWWLLQIGKVGNQPFQLDPHATAFNCGELNVGQQMLARFVEINPIGFAELQIERQNESDRRTEYLNRVVSGGIDPSTGYSGPGDNDS